MDNNSYIPDVLHVFSSVENGGLNLILNLAKTLTSMTVA